MAIMAVIEQQADHNYVNVPHMSVVDAEIIEHPLCPRVQFQFEIGLAIEYYVCTQRDM
jgi:hypothetical protein